MKHLRQLEDQSVYILREAYKHFDDLTFADFDEPARLFGDALVFRDRHLIAGFNFPFAQAHMGFVGRYLHGDRAAHD